MALETDDLKSHTRTELIGGKVTPEEFEDFTILCKKLGITKSRYIRHLAIQAINADKAQGKK